MGSIHIKNSIKSLCFTKDYWKIDLLRSWSDIIGNLQARVTIEKIDETVITVGVADSCLLQELYLLSSLLCTLINERLDSPRIKTVRFKKIGISRIKNKKKSVVQNNRARKPMLLTPQEMMALTTVPDKDLQELLKKFRVRCLEEEE